jgi:hypothetical protein
MAPSVTLRLVAFVRTDVSEELSSSNIRVTRIDELVLPKSRLLQEAHGVTSQKTPFSFVFPLENCWFCASRDSDRLLVGRYRRMEFEPWKAQDSAPLRPVQTDPGAHSIVEWAPGLCTR